MPEALSITGLVAATHTPLHPDGSLTCGAVEAQARHLAENGIAAAFICGSTGEAHSLSVAERMDLCRRWSEVLDGTRMRLIVHVGHNALPEARALAAHAQQCGAAAIAALAPNYFKPAAVADLVDFCSALAAEAPELPFYFYDIPSMTGVSLPMDQFLTLAQERIPTLAGLKFTSADGHMLQNCLHHSGGRFEILFGVDECLLGALALGVRGAVGSTYNYAAPIYHRLLAAFARGDLAAARAEQWKSAEVVRVCAGFGYARAAKAVMGMLGVDCGPVRLPLRALDQPQIATLRQRLEEVGFFAWIRP